MKNNTYYYIKETSREAKLINYNDTQVTLYYPKFNKYETHKAENVKLLGYYLSVKF